MTIILTALISVPFIGNTDSNRLQMTAKQMVQSLNCTNCVRPYVISEKWNYLIS